MMRRLAAVLLLTACNGGDLETTAPAAAPGLYTALCAARGMPEEPPLSPRQHLHATGTVDFVTPEQSQRQRAELWLGGPARMRFMATSESGTRNVFLLEAPGLGWVNEAKNVKKWKEYRSPEVEREVLLRWEVLRFPWGWRSIVEAAGADVRVWSRRIGEGELVIEVGDDLLPRSATYVGVDVKLEKWLPADDAPWSVARRWSWSGPSGFRGEHYEQLGVQWLLFDDWYRPPAQDGAPDRSHRALGAAESFGVVRGKLWIADWTPDAPDQSGWQWWLRGKERIAAVLLAPESPPPSHPDEQPPRASEHELWLRWSFAGTPEQAQSAAAELEGIARESGFRALGPVLQSEAERAANSITILLPIAAKDS